MPKNSVDDWSTNHADNTDVGGTSIRGSARPSNVDDALRKIMAQVAEFRDDLPNRYVETTLIRDDIAAVKADTATSYPTGTVITARKEGFSWVVVESDEHITTAGGVKLQAAGPEVNVEQFGAIGDGDTDCAPALSTAIDYAVATGRTVVRLPAGRFKFSSSTVSKTALAGHISIEGAGSSVTTIVADDSLVASGAVLGLSRPWRTGALTVSWPTSDGHTFADEHPETILTSDAVPGDWTIEVDDASNLSVGDLIMLKSQRLDEKGETRNCIMCGELNAITAIEGNVIQLRYPIADGYNTGTVWTGTATAGAASSITIDTGLDAGAVIGCRITITSGTGAGQTRYINDYDPDTGVATLVTSGSWPQDVFSPQPDGTSEVVIDCPTYVFSLPDPLDVSVRGITFECVNPDGVSRGLTIQGAMRPVIEDVCVKGARNIGLNLYYCAEPQISDLTVYDANNGSSLGLACIVGACRNGYARGISSFNCRRGGIDTQGFIPTWGFLIKDTRTVGGYKDATGNLWTTVDQDGLGTHGQARQFVFDGYVIEGVRTGHFVRGFDTAFYNGRQYGLTGRMFALHQGSKLEVHNFSYQSRSVDLTSPQAGDAIADGGHAFYITSSWKGGVIARHLRFDGMQGSLVYVDGSASLGVNERVTGPLSITDYKIGYRSSGTVYLLDGSQQYTAEGWEIGELDYTVRGGGTFVFSQRFTPASSVAGRAMWFKLGDTYRASIPDDSVVAIPHYANGQTDVRMWQDNSANTIRVDGILRQTSTFFSPYATSLGSVTVAALASVPTGTSGSDGNLSLHHSGEAFYVENRTGATVELVFAIRNA